MNSLWIPLHPPTASNSRAITLPVTIQKTVNTTAAVIWISSTRHTGVRASGAVRQENVADQALTCATPERIAAKISALLHGIPPEDLSTATSTRVRNAHPAQYTTYCAFPAFIVFSYRLIFHHNPAEHRSPSQDQNFLWRRSHGIHHRCPCFVAKPAKDAFSLEHHVPSLRHRHLNTSQDRLHI